MTTSTNIKKVVASDDANLIEFARLNAATAVLNQRQAQGIADLGAQVAAGQNSLSLIVQRSGVLGSVASEADLAGKNAGDWRIGQQLVTWNGNAVTARTPILAAAGDPDVAAAQVPPTVANEAALAGRAAGQYRLASTDERVAWTGAAVAARSPMPAPAASSGQAALAQVADPNNASAALAAWLPRALSLRSGEIPAGTYRLTQRLVIDCQNQRFDLNVRGRLQFDVPDANGGPMIRILNPARGSLLNFGEIEVLFIPPPSRDITEGNESESDIGVPFGPPFERTDTHPGVVRRYWRTHSDHAIEIVNGQDCVVTVQVKNARAMGLVLNGGKNMHLYGSVANTLADGTHMHNGPQNIYWWMDAENCGDDAFPVVPKPGEPQPRNIHYFGTAKGGYARHFVFAGGEMIYWNGTQSTDAYKESYLCTEDTFYQSGVPAYLYATDIFSVNAGQRDTSQQGEAQPAAFRVSMVPGGNEHHIFLTRGNFTGARGAGMWLGGKLVTVTDTQSTGNGLPNHVYAADAVIQGRGSVYDQMVVHQSYATVKDVRFRKGSSNGAYALLLTGPGQVGAQIIGNDFGAGWTYPLATDGALDSTCVVRDNTGLALGDLPPAGTAGIANTPALPGSGAGWLKNDTPFDVIVMIHGGTVLSINIRSPNGATVDVGALRMFSLPRGWSINPFWTAAPERWVWAVSR